MHYLIYAEDAPDSLEKRRSVRAAHLERIERLKSEGRLIVAGPFLEDDETDSSISGVKGSLIIAEFDNLADAKAWAAADPYATAHVYANITVKPFKKIL
jgi:uncharacterized protein YciI